MRKKVFDKFIFILTFLFILSFQYKFCYNFTSSKEANAYPSLQLYPGGQSIGVKLNTKGVLIVALSEIKGEDGKVYCPAKECGIKAGDSIVKINNKEVNTCEQVSSEIQLSDGKEIEMTIERKGSIIKKRVNVIKSKGEDVYRIGLWIRDSTAGIGTLTFYEKNTEKFGALGHGITDMDTDSILNVKNGDIISSSIIGIQKGYRGKPGELKGIFVNNNKKLGKIEWNKSCGIFGKAECSLINSNSNKPLNVGYRNEVKLGKAKILTTVAGEKTCAYDIEILQLIPQSSPSPKSMMIRITDKRLLNQTGGIIQGMSGSPIIQNNKIIGAVTHVLVNKPDTGYGVYIEWMLKQADILP